MSDEGHISILKIVESTTVDGPGLRTSVYCAGCPNACPRCHNPQSWDIGNGTPTPIDDIMAKIVAEDFCDVTFTGGDPMYQAAGFTALARRIKRETRKTIWCYTGFTFERCYADPAKRRLLDYVDVLVDGPFVESLKSDELLFRGSSNQRIIDVAQTLASATPNVPILAHPEAGLFPEI